MTQRILDFASIYNFRDFGAYDTVCGNKVVPGQLFRSAHLSNATDDDVQKMADLKIGLVVDLRHAPERQRQPNRLPANPSPAVMEYPDLPEALNNELAPHEMFIREDLRRPQDARDYMNRSYAVRPEDQGFQTIFSNTLKFMAREGEPLLIHCAAGKDRTGTLAAIIHGALGLDRDTIMEDFMLTMQAVDIDSFLEPAAAMMQDRFGRNFDPESLRPMFGVEPSYLENALATIGDMDRYIQDTLGITPDERTAIRDNYLA